MPQKLWIWLVAVMVFWGVWTPRSGAQTPTVWYVNGALETNGDGTTWETAFSNLDSALSDAQPDQEPPDQIWLATGAYRPQEPQPPADPRTAIFAIPSGVEVYGGFVGGEDELGDRRPDLNITVLSGERGEPGVPSDNCYCVVSMTQWLYASRLDGFTIRDGYGGWLNSGYGAGLYISGSPTIANCCITDCTAPPWGAGGGVYVETGAPAFTRCRIENCQAGTGGALYLADGSAQMTIDRCVLTSNTAQTRAAALFNARPGLVRTVNTIFVGNVCLGNDAGGTVAHFSSNAQYVNCLFNGNRSLGDGAAMWNSTPSTVLVLNASFSGNEVVCGNGCASGRETA